jgi:hypothetical protein
MPRSHALHSVVATAPQAADPSRKRSQGLFDRALA